MEGHLKKTNLKGWNKQKYTKKMPTCINLLNLWPYKNDEVQSSSIKRWRMNLKKNYTKRYKKNIIKRMKVKIKIKNK
jgi:hypothetical protein